MELKKVLISLLMLLSIHSIVKSKTNTYAPVVDATGSVVTLLAGHKGKFVVGEQALIMQMKGAEIIEENAAVYGRVKAYNAAGTYEFAIVTAIAGDVITLNISVDAYDVNSYVQLISVPGDGLGGFTEDGTNEPLPFDGYSGGVYVVNVCGTYTLNGSLLSTGGGFRGGAINYEGNYYDVAAQQWVAKDLKDNVVGSFKGEGIASTFCTEGDIYPLPNYDPVVMGNPKGWSSGGWAYYYDNAEDGGDLCSVHDQFSGALANAGGSGTQVDGGGGGGNGGAGGDGGCGWDENFGGAHPMNGAGFDLTDVQGVGGYAVGLTTGARVHLGGGGGAGWLDSHIDNDGEAWLSNTGKDGGVIYIIRAGQFDGNGFSIQADGATQDENAGWQASGGGGAGGSIFVDAPVANNVNLYARGGNGGSSVWLNPYQPWIAGGELGPGGGGGGGVILAPGCNDANARDVSGGINGVFWDENKNCQYCSEANAVAWCAESGADGLCASLSLPSPTCVITQIPVTCQDNDGELAARVYLPLCSSGEPMSVLWSNGATSSNLNIGDTATIVGLTGGTYTMTVTDEAGMTGSCSSVLVDPSPPIVLSDVHVDETVCGDNDGSIDITWEGGGSYPDITTTTKFDGAGGTFFDKEGTYFDIVVSGINQSLTDENMIAQVCLDITTVPNDKIEKVDIWLETPCGGNKKVQLKSDGNPGGNGFTNVCFEPGAGANITTGTSPFNGVWIPEGGDLDEVGGPLIGCDPNGTWRLWLDNKVMDEGELADWSITLNDVEPVTGPPTYVWSHDNSTDVSVSRLGAGIYTITASDNEGCTQTREVVITCPNMPPICSINNDRDPLCAGSADGWATVTVYGMSPSFSIVWTNGAIANNMPDAGTDQQTNLSDGTYTVTVTDNVGLTGSCSVLMIEPLQIMANIIDQTDPLCFGGTDGDATVEASGGTPNYSYLWDLSTTSQTT
ncbi:MAG: SprB repeat-containing protein, partial [Flavobacteriales bacterium]|nr:SprB repeat-containing protein [Flavobacteriales bacterium]